MKRLVFSYEKAARYWIVNGFFYAYLKLLKLNLG